MTDSSSFKSGSLTLHALTSTATDSQLSSIMDLSSHIFASVPSDPTTHTSPAFWRDRLSHPNAHILYITHSSSPEQPLGFVYNFPRVHDELGSESLHVWLAGVAEEARGQGVFPLLMEETRRRAKDAGFEYVTVATLPERFGKMFRLLRGNGWTEVAWKETELGRKVIMKLEV